jgi:hypothetical protein
MQTVSCPRNTRYFGEKTPRGAMHLRPAGLARRSRLGRTFAPHECPERVCAKRVRAQKRPSLLPSKKDAGFVLFRRARSIERNIARRSVKLHQVIADEIMFHFLATDIGEHDPFNFDARRKRLPTFLFHFPSKRRVLDNIFFFVRQAILCQDCPDTSAPAAMGFQIGDNLRIIHNV